jgi:uncharacterized protein (UPF0548 family)
MEPNVLANLVLLTVITIGRDHTKTLEDRLQRAGTELVTYSEVGFTRCQTQPPGYRHDRLTAPLGRGDEVWSRAPEAVRTWWAHHHAGITVTPGDTRIQEGNTILASRSLGPILLIAPCRIVYLSDTPNRFGFAYGTLPGHPEQGEEAFHVIRHDDGTVEAEIVAFSRPADLPTRLASPLAREIQKAVTRRYVQGIRDYVDRGK